MIPAEAGAEAPRIAVRCRGLIKRYHDVIAVDGLDLEVEAGTCFGLLGPNGAGKTTTIEIFEGLVEPDAGRVEVLGLRWHGNESKLRERLGIQLQETQLAEKLTVAETVRLFRSFYPDGRPVDEILDAVRLGEKRNVWVSRLSAGQRQRLALACALAGRPDILFLDEPTTGLDPHSRLAVWDMVSRFRRAGGTVVLTTHNMEEAARVCDVIAIVDHGRIIAQGTAKELIAGLGAADVVEFSVAEGATAPTSSELARLPGVTGVHLQDGRISLTVLEVHSAVPPLLEALARRGAALRSLSTHHASLEDVFVALTGRRLRDV